jgi:shikimate kinase
MNNIILIGMPSSGKSTVGPLLAKKLGMGFLDTDLLIKNRENMNLRDIINKRGLKEFLEIQECAAMGLDVENHVIATGGSIVYNTGAMEFLRGKGMVIYLQLGFEELEKRVSPSRRFARNMEQSFKDLYNERIPLYCKFADIIINCSGKDENMIANEIASSAGIEK